MRGVIDDSTLKSIADKIREKTGGEEKYTPSEMTDGVEKVYDSQDERWENLITGDGTKITYASFFERSDWSGYVFKKTLKPSGESNYTLSRMFYNYKGSVLPGNIDLSMASQRAVTSVNSYAYQLFTWSQNVKEIPDYGLPALNLGASFDYLRSCHTIEKIRITETNTPPFFYDCDPLKNLTFEGTIGKDLNVSGCPLLTHDSLINIIACLKDYSDNTDETVHTLTLGTTNLSKLTDEEKAMITQKGWQTL